MSMALKPGDTVRLRKRHPCGNYEWEVLRVGADVGLRCTKCNRKVLVSRSVFERRVTAVTPAGVQLPEKEFREG